MCRQVLKQHGGGLRILRVFGADSEREDFPVPRRIDHKGIQNFKTQSVPVEMRRFTLHWRCHAAVDEEPSAEALKTRQAYERLRATSLKSKDFDEARAEYYDALTKARAVEIHQSDIIFTTCVSARRMALVAALTAEGAPEVRQVILDEAGQAPEPEALCPLAVARHARQAIFFGDHKQLRPILRSRLAEGAGLGISLFERLATQDWSGHGEPPVSLLAQQYRMHPAISFFSCQQFYDGRVLDDSSVHSRAPGLLSNPSTGKQAALLLWDSAGCSSGGQEQLQRVRTVGAGGVGSRSNIEEANRAAALAADLAREAGAQSVAVLSWYNSQVAKVSEILRRSGASGVHVGSIATAQGSEWDYVILSAVRSGSGGGSLGLVADPHNLNVALTRAKLGLVILCDSSAVRRDRNWNALINRCSSDGLVVHERPVVRMGPRPSASAQSQAYALQAPPPPPPPLPMPPRSLRQDFGGQATTPAAMGYAEKRRSDAMDPNNLELQRQIMALLAMQSQGQLRRCTCGNFANPALNGLCNNCASQMAYMSFPSGAGASSLQGQPPFPPTPSSALHSSLQELLPGQAPAAPRSTPSPPQPRAPPGTAAAPQSSVREVLLVDSSSSSSERKPRRRSLSDESRRRPQHAPKSRSSKARRRSSTEERRRRSARSSSRSDGEPMRREAPRRSSSEDGSAGTRSPSGSRSHDTPSSCKRPRRVWTKRSDGSHRHVSADDLSDERHDRASSTQAASSRTGAARGLDGASPRRRSDADGFRGRGSAGAGAQASSPEEPAPQRGARNALFGYSPAQAQTRKAPAGGYDDRIRGG
mmetsp:Transcript_76106/g.226831  ORF Transcript_76106/g.226831 Transcript_76106/m.226831 type:complete len:816 (+) Transcript_76106:371-2818(+)